MSLAISRLQKAIYTVLSGDGLLMGMISGVHDTVPENASYPYVVIGDGAQERLSADSDIGEVCSLQIFSYSKALGRKETHSILERIYALLNFATPSLGSGQVLSLRIDRAEAKALPELQMVQGELRVMAVVTGG